jgi:outer membrane protein TolC
MPRTSPHADLLSMYSVRVSGPWLVAAACALLAAMPARALQPLDQYLAGARATSTDNRRAELLVKQRDAEIQGALGAQLPTLAASEGLTHYSTGSASRPQDVRSGVVTVTVPLLDAAAWARTGGARDAAHAAREGARATSLDVERRVVEAYYALTGAEALRLADQRAEKAAEANLALTRDRRAEGMATELDVQRAAAQLESVRQDLAGAELTIALQRRSLLTLTSLEPSPAAVEAADDLREELPLAWWEARADGAGVPSVAQAAAERRSAEAGADAARRALLPTLRASASLGETNAPLLYGGSRYATAGATLSWSFDLTSLSSIRSQEATAGAARVAEEAARDSARDTIHQAWQQVRTGLTRVRSARAQAGAAGLAAEVARERYQAGTGTQLEVVQAERDLLGAEAARIQAEADLTAARAALRLAAGLGATSDVSALSSEGTAP